MAFDGLGVGSAPFAGIYGLAVLSRRWAYDRKLLAIFKPQPFTVSIGGLEVGGTGKTPIAGLVLRAFVAAGKNPGLLSRGFLRKSTGLIVREKGALAEARVIGDEPAMLVADGIDVPVAVCNRRSDGARALSARQCDTLVLDDGFVHRALDRDVDIVVLNGDRPFGNGHLLPWGTLREPRSSLRRAHVVWLHFRGEPVLARPAWVDAVCPSAALVVSQAQPDVITNAKGEVVDARGESVVAAAGIARPEKFFSGLQGQGILPRAFFPFRDHHLFSSADVALLEKACRKFGASHLVVTAKDAVKLKALWPDDRLWVAAPMLRICSGQVGLAQILRLDRDTDFFSSLSNTH